MPAKPQLAFIGGGTMAEALIKGLLSQGLFEPSALLVSDPLEARLDSLRETYGIQTTTENLKTVEAETLVFAVKPPQLPDVLREVGPHWRPTCMGLSIVAGFRLDLFAPFFPQGTPPLVRAMPNTPCVIGEGITAIAPNPDVSREQLDLARAIFKAVGEVLELPEHYFDAVTGLSGSGPAYVTLIIEALIEAGVQQGLPRRISRELVCQTVKGATMLVQQSGKHPAELKEQVTTPAGTTAAGLHVLEQAAIRATLSDAVSAATERSKALAPAATPAPRN
ncbi:Pyrroline-5-carboxylate reductase [compost metagenome]